MRWVTRMVGVEVDGREPRTSNLPTPVLTILVSKRSSRRPLAFWIWTLVSLAILRSESRYAADCAGLLATKERASIKPAVATAQSKISSARFGLMMFDKVLAPFLILSW